MSTKETASTVTVSCLAAHNWRDSYYGIKPTAGCAPCEARQRKITYIEQLDRENTIRYARAVSSAVAGVVGD